MKNKDFGRLIKHGACAITRVCHFKEQKRSIVVLRFCEYDAVFSSIMRFKNFWDYVPTRRDYMKTFKAFLIAGPRKKMCKQYLTNLDKAKITGISLTWLVNNIIGFYLLTGYGYAEERPERSWGFCTKTGGNLFSLVLPVLGKTNALGVRIFFCKLSFCGKIYIFQGRAFVLPSYNIS